MVRVLDVAAVAAGIGLLGMAGHAVTLGPPAAPFVRFPGAALLAGDSRVHDNVVAAGLLLALVLFEHRLNRLTKIQTVSYARAVLHVVVVPKFTISEFKIAIAAFDSAEQFFDAAEEIHGGDRVVDLIVEGMILRFPIHESLESGGERGSRLGVADLGAKVRFAAVGGGVTLLGHLEQDVADPAFVRGRGEVGVDQGLDRLRNRVPEGFAGFVFRALAKCIPAPGFGSGRNYRAMIIFVAIGRLVVGV